MRNAYSLFLCSEANNLVLTGENVSRIEVAIASGGNALKQKNTSYL